jgi:hypothetical protein
MNSRRLMVAPIDDDKLPHCAIQQNWSPMSQMGLVSRVTPVDTALRNCTRDEGRSFEVGDQVLISSHRKLLSSKAMVVNVAEKSGQDSGRQG